MTTDTLSDTTWNLARKCVGVITNSNLISEGGFSPRIGVDRSKAQDLLAQWDKLDRSNLNEEQDTIIHNCFNEVCHGVPRSLSAWRSKIGVSSEQLEAAFAEWMQATGFEEVPDLD